MEMYRQELRTLASDINGWHLGVSRVSTKQMEEFSLKEMTHDIELNAPQWWRLLGLLLGPGERLEGHTLEGIGSHRIMDNEMDDLPPSLDDSEDYWNEVDGLDLEGFISRLAEERSSRLLMKDRRKRRRIATLTTVCSI